jgi:hypothetical protein
MLGACSPALYLDGLLKRGNDTGHTGSFGQRGELDERANGVASSPSLGTVWMSIQNAIYCVSHLVWDAQRVHDLVRPSVFDLVGLLEFEGLWGERPNDSDRTLGVEISGQGRTGHMCLESIFN